MSSSPNPTPKPKPKPAPPSGITAFLDAYSVAPARPGDSERFLSWVAEIAWLSEMHGAATPALWHEVVRGRAAEVGIEVGGDGDGAEPGPGSAKPTKARKGKAAPAAAPSSSSTFSRTSSNRHFARLKNDLIRHGVPHERVKVESLDDDGRGMGASMVGIKITVSRTQLERFALPLKRCVRSSCEWHEKGIPARPPWFYRNAAAADGLDSMCSTCRRSVTAAARKRAKVKVAEGGPKKASTPAMRAAWRKYNASKAGRARSSKFNVNCRPNADTPKNQVNGSLEEIYRQALTEFAKRPISDAATHESTTIRLLADGRQPDKETKLMSVAASLSIRGLLAAMNAPGAEALGPGKRVTERMVKHLLATFPELEPPRFAGARAFEASHVERIRAAFEARAKAMAARKGRGQQARSARPA